MYTVILRHTNSRFSFHILLTLQSYSCILRSHKPTLKNFFDRSSKILLKRALKKHMHERYNIPRRPNKLKNNRATQSSNPEIETWRTMEEYGSMRKEERLSQPRGLIRPCFEIQKFAYFSHTKGTNKQQRAAISITSFFKNRKNKRSQKIS